MRTALGLSLLAAIAVAALPAAAAPAPAAGERRDAREQAPPGLLGLWKADIAASTYPSAKPRSALRSFQYTADGKVMVSFMTVGANGAYSAGHWAAQVDGTPGIEYHTAAGSTPYNQVVFKKLDDATLDLVVSRHGVVNLHATYKIAPDGQTLTYSYDQTTIVYRRWEKMDW